MKKRLALLACLFGIMIMTINIPAVADKMERVQNMGMPITAVVVPVSLQLESKSHPLYLSDEQLYAARAKAPFLISSIREMLRNREFKKLNATLSQYEKAFEEDVSNENKLFDVYDAFAVNDDSYEVLLDEWVAAYPESHQPYLMRASYFHKQGWLSRGGKWAKETSEKQFEEMGANFLKALNDIESSLLINQSHAVSYSLLINVYKSLGNSDGVWSIVSKGLKEAPLSFKIRSSYLLAATPRWGGSYEEMDRFADEAQVYLSKNPRLIALKSYAFYDAGRLQMTAKNYGTARQLLDAAISLGEVAIFYEQRARALQYLKEYNGALKDINRAIEMNAHESSFYYRKSRILSDKKMMPESLVNIEIADQLSPNDKRTIKYKKWIAAQFISVGYKKRKAGDINGALEDYNFALRANPDDGSSYYWRAQVLVDAKDLKSAYRDLKRSIQLDPNNFDAYHLMDWVLAQSSGWDEVIDYWGKYIALNPKSDKAYLERGGAYFRKGDVVSAVADAKKAADLGSLEGKQVYERYKNRVN